MGRAKIVVPPPKDYVPEPLVSPPVEIPVEEIIVNDECESNLSQEIEDTQMEEEVVTTSQENLVKKDKKKTKISAQLAAELEELRRQNEELSRQKESAEKAREETILAMRNKATEQRGNQLNIVKQRKPSLWSKIKSFFSRRRIEVATVGIKNYETAILQRARIAVPKMLDDLEKMHEQLTIMEELLAKYQERQKIKDQ